MSTELRSPREAEHWLCAGLCLTRLHSPTPEALAESLPWLLATLSEVPALPPPGVVLDLGRLATGASLSAASPLPDTSPALRAALRAYEDHVLARLAAEPHLEAVVNALARLPAALRPRGVAFLVSRVLTRLAFESGTSVSPGLARRTLEPPPAELLQAGFAALRQPGAALERLAEGYEALGHGARRARALLGDTEIFTLENLEHLQGLAQRLALQQAVEAAETLEQALPPRLRPRPLPAGRVPAHLEEEASYPLGGFSSVSNVGSLENLVTSELVYMEDEAELDLFDVRYVEGELLYYTRDESLFVRRRRVVTFVLLPELAQARVKDAQVPWQRLVVVLGLVLCLVRRLTLWLSQEELRFRVLFLHEGQGPGPLEAEQGLCTLLLREWRTRGLAEVDTAGSLESVLAQAAVDARRARTEVVLLGTGTPREAASADARLGVGTLEVGQPRPTLAWRGRPPVELPPGSPWEAWLGVVLELAQGLL